MKLIVPMGIMLFGAVMGGLCIWRAIENPTMWIFAAVNGFTFAVGFGLFLDQLHGPRY